jgi:hypothetical protein
LFSLTGARRAHLFLIVAAVCATQLLTLAAGQAAAQTLRVAKPEPDQLFARQKAGVLLHTSTTLRHLSASLNGRDVRNSFTRLRRGLWRGGFGPGKLKLGPNRLLFSTEDRAGNEEFVSHRFVVGKHRASYLSLRAPGRAAGGVVIVARMRSSPELRFRAQLNGKPTHGLFSPNFGRVRVARIGADDGLRFGRNVLRVTAAKRDGSFDVEQRTIFVRPDRPLVAAGPDRRSAGLKPVALDGRKSRPASAGGKAGASARRAAALDYRWEVVRAPRGSKARPADPTSARTTFRPDRVGTYRLRLTAGEGGRRGADVVTVREIENVPPIGVPIDTIAYTNTEAATTETAIAIGADTYPLGRLEGDRVQAVILDRETLELLAAPSYPGTAADAEALLKRIKGVGPRGLVAIANPSVRSDSQVDPRFQEVVEYLGAPPIPKVKAGASGWSAIGVPESGDGGDSAAGTNPDNTPYNEEGSLDGFLTRDSSGLFTFVPGSTVPFDTAVPGGAPMRNAIQVGGARHESGSLQCQGGDGAVQVLVLYAETLALDENGSRTFTTHGCGEGVAEQELLRLEEMLSDVATANQVGRGSKLVFLQTFGQSTEPVPGAAAEIASVLERLGGTAAVFASATGSYSLVGQFGISGFPLAEASSSLTGKPARNTGILEPNRLGSYVPAVSSPTGTAPFGLAAIAFQPAQPWPNTSAGELAALSYLAGKLELPAPTVENSCYVPAKPDVRSEYCNQNIAHEWRAKIGTVRRKAPYVSGRGFTEADLLSVKGELIGGPEPGEFGELAAVQDTWNTIDLLQKPFGAGGETGAVDLNSLAAQVEKALQPPRESEARGFWLNLLSGIGFVGSYFAPGVGETITGVISGALGVAALFANEPSGSPVLGEFTIGADDLAVELEANYATASRSLYKVGSLIVSDYGKLRAVAADPSLEFSAEEMEQMQSSLELGGREWIYQELFPTAYEAFSVAPGQVNPAVPASADSYECVDRGVEELRTKPFSAPADAQYRYESPTPTLGVLVAKGSPVPADEVVVRPVASPTAEMLEPVFRSAFSGGLGQYRPWFWREAFGFPGPGIKTVSC